MTPSNVITCVPASVGTAFRRSIIHFLLNSKPTPSALGGALPTISPLHIQRDVPRYRTLARALAKEIRPTAPDTVTFDDLYQHSKGTIGNDVHRYNYEWTVPWFQWASAHFDGIQPFIGTMLALASAVQDFT